MIIGDPAAFKSWLITILEPLCDADPPLLAEYVFALVSRDKPLAELRASLVEELDVFLHSETKNFVDSLFKTLKSQVYDVPVTPTTTTVPHTAPAIADALAKYMFAIVNKDKSVAELRASVVEQLDVFLRRETKKFLNSLFKTLETQVCGVPAASDITAVPSTVPEVASEPTTTRMPVTTMPAQPLLSQTLSIANPSSTQTFCAHECLFAQKESDNIRQQKKFILKLKKDNCRLRGRLKELKGEVVDLSEEEKWTIESPG